MNEIDIIHKQNKDAITHTHTHTHTLTYTHTHTQFKTHTCIPMALEETLLTNARLRADAAFPRGCLASWAGHTLTILGRCGCDPVLTRWTQLAHTCAVLACTRGAWHCTLQQYRLAGPKQQSGWSELDDYLSGSLTLSPPHCLKTSLLNATVPEN